MYENKTIGKEPEKLQPKEMEIKNVREETVTKKTGENVGDKLILTLQYEDDREIEISGIKYLRGKEIKESALWLNVDDEGNIPFNSAVAHFIRYYGINSIKDMVGLKIQTTQDERGYLIVKAY